MSLVNARTYAHEGAKHDNKEWHWGKRQLCKDIMSGRTLRFRCVNLFESVFMIDICSGGSFVTIDRQFL